MKASLTYAVNTAKTENGRLFIIANGQCRCAECLFMQQSFINEHTIKDKKGRVTHLGFDIEGEDHSESCKQKP